MLDNETIHNQLISRRTFLLAALQTSLLSCLFGRIFFLQFLRSADYKKLSDKNRLTLIMIPPARGIIVDSKGIVLADNKPCFVVKLDLKQTKNYRASFDKLSELLSIPSKLQQQLISKINKSHLRSQVTLIENLSWQQLSLIEENLLELPGIHIEDNTLRNYNYPTSTAHIIGYIGKINEQEQAFQQRINSVNLQLGKTGIEKQYENLLQGTFGYCEMEVDAHGLYINELSKVESIAGDRLTLNIDVMLQDKIQELMYAKGSSAVVMDVNSGAILALSSSPAFNLNEFVGGVSSKYWQQLNADIYLPLRNKTIQNQYPPGSPFKLITILAALEAGCTPNQKFHCAGFITLGNKQLNCWRHQGHGLLDMIQSLKHSCNCYMYQISRQIGAEAIIQTARKFGFGVLTGIDLPNEQKGFVPDKTWKLKRFKYDWSIGDTMNIAIGQGALLVTPLQLARMTAAIANGGKLVTPRLVGINEGFEQIAIQAAHLDVIKEGMNQVVNSPGGSAYRSRPSSIILAGKTGTAQVQQKKNLYDDLSRKSIAWERRNHGLFVGFAPFSSPKYAIAVIADHGGSGAGDASPIASEICKLLF